MTRKPDLITWVFAVSLLFHNFIRVLLDRKKPIAKHPKPYYNPRLIVLG